MAGLCLKSITSDLAFFHAILSRLGVRPRTIPPLLSTTSLITVRAKSAITFHNGVSPQNVAVWLSQEITNHLSLFVNIDKHNILIEFHCLQFYITLLEKYT